MATLLEQSIEYQKQELAQLRAQQVEFDRIGSELFRQTRDARNALNAARADPTTPPATLNQLQQTYDRIQEERATNNYNREANEFKISQIETALQNNETKLANPANNTSLATAGNTTSDPGTNPEINQQANTQLNQASGNIPAGQTGTPSEPPVPINDTANTEDGDDFFEDEDGNIQRFPSRRTADVVENSEPDDIEGDEGEETFFEGEFISEPPEVDQEPILEGDEGEEFFTDQTDPGYVPAGSSKGLEGAKNNARSQATAQDVANFQQREDWRVRLSLAPNATYLYKDTTNALLKPLRDTDGIIFPYTPRISVQYMANYDQSVLTHSNYKIFQYTGSSVDNVTIECDFTAQDTFEANYLMAVIHFLRSVTKMFYGQDQDPKPGVPPPLCYLTGLGAFQFDAHPLAITSFNYALPTDVDYIRAGTINSGAGVNRSPANTPNNSQVTSTNRLGPNLQPGGVGRAAVFQSEPAGTTEPTYVPTKMNIQISAIPIVSRNDISNNFSLKKYATGELLRGTRRKAGGIW